MSFCGERVERDSARVGESESKGVGEGESLVDRDGERGIDGGIESEKFNSIQEIRGWVGGWSHPEFAVEFPWGPVSKPFKPSFAIL